MIKVVFFRLVSKLSCCKCCQENPDDEEKPEQKEDDIPDVKLD